MLLLYKPLDFDFSLNWKTPLKTLSDVTRITLQDARTKASER